MGFVLIHLFQVVLMKVIWAQHIKKHMKNEILFSAHIYLHLNSIFMQVACKLKQGQTVDRRIKIEVDYYYFSWNRIYT